MCSAFEKTKWNFETRHLLYVSLSLSQSWYLPLRCAYYPETFGNFSKIRLQNSCFTNNWKKFAKMSISVHICLSISLYVHQWKGFRENNFFFANVCRENSAGIKFWQKIVTVNYMKTCVYLWWYFTQLFSVWVHLLTNLHNI